MESYKKLLLVFLSLSLCLSLACGAGQSKSKEQGTQTEGGSRKLTVFDYVRSGALLIAFLATGFCGRKTWLLADNIMVAATGFACYLFPGAMIGYQVEGTLDPMHIYAGQIYATLCIGMAVIQHYIRNSRDEGAIVSLLFSRIVYCSTGLIVALADHLKSAGDAQRFAPQHLCFGVTGFVGVLLINLYYLVTTQSFSTGTVSLSTRVSRHALIDIVFVLAASMYHFGYPELNMATVTMKNFTPDVIHAHLIRHLGIGAFSLAIFGLGSLAFNKDEDRLAYFKGRLVIAIIVILTVILYYLKYQFITLDHLIGAIVFNALIVLNLALALSHASKSKRS